MGDMQLNKVFGRITMEQHGGPPRRPTDNLPSLDRVNNGTPNQKEERVAILLRMYAKPVSVDLLLRAIALCLMLLRAQKERGHQVIARACEFMTNSHAPIWIRAMTSQTVTVLELIGPTRDEEPVLASRLPANLRDELRTLRDELIDWWRTFYFCCKAVEVTHGGLSEHFISTGARYREGGDDQVRDVAMGLLDGQHPNHVAGDKFWKNTMVFQDTFGAQLMKRLCEQHIFNELVVAAPKAFRPTLPGDFTVIYYADGHTTQMPFLGAKDPKEVTVRYSDGEVWSGPAESKCGDQLRLDKIGRPAESNPAEKLTFAPADEDE